MQRLRTAVERITATWERFWALSRRYWPAYVIAILVWALFSDWWVGWANHQIEKVGVGVLETVADRVFLSPAVLPMLVFSGLMVAAFVQSGRPSPIEESAYNSEYRERFGKYEGIWAKNVNDFRRLFTTDGPLDVRFAGIRDDLSPHLYLVVRFLNCSIFDVEFLIEGGLRFENKPFDATMHIENDASQVGYHQGERIQLRVRVVPTSPVAIGKLKEAVDTRETIVLDPSGFHVKSRAKDFDNPWVTHNFVQLAFENDAYPGREP